MTKAMIYRIRGWGCGRCGAQMIGISKQNALEHYTIPMDEPLPTGFVFRYTKGIAGIITGEGKLVQEGQPYLIHGHAQPLMLYSFKTKSLILKNRHPPVRLNSRATKTSLNEGTLDLLSQEEYEEVKNYLKVSIDSARRPIDLKRTLPFLEKTLKH